jgi:hypothetical protein
MSPRIRVLLLGLDLDVSAGGVELTRVELPSPLHKVGAGGASRDLEASTASTTVLVGVSDAVGVLQLGNGVLEQHLLSDVLAVADWRHVDEDRGGSGASDLGMVLGGPTNTERVTDGGGRHTTPLATISGRSRSGASFVRSTGGTVLEVGASQGPAGVAAILLVVAVGVLGVQRSKRKTEGEATGVSDALATLVSPILLLGVVELPVDAVGPGVGFSNGGVGGEDGQSGDDEHGERRLENHCDQTEVDSCLEGECREFVVEVYLARMFSV